MHLVNRYLGACVVAAVLLGSTVNAAPPPNIVVILTDDAGYSDFGFMDPLTRRETDFRTPRLDALARQSILFSNAYVSAPVCAPSRAGLLTGRFGGRFGFETNIINANSPNDGVPLSEMFVSQALQQLGYYTGAVGKWHLGRGEGMLPLEKGFDEFFGFLGGSRPYFGESTSPNWQIRRGNDASNWTSEPSFTGVTPDPVNGRYLTDALGDAAAEFISRRAREDEPFFLYAPFSSAHSPFEAKQQDFAEFADATMNANRRAIAAMTLAMDRAVGNMLDRLDDPNGDGNQDDSISDNTIVVFLNDNGGTIPPSGELRHDNTPLKGGKGQAFEGGIRTPMLVRAPGLAAAAFNEPVSALDLYPTIMAAAGGQPPNMTDGRNLMPYLNGNVSGPVHEALYWRGGLNYWAIRKGDWKLAKPHSSSEIRLVRLAEDGTGEDVNLADAEPEIFDELLRDYVNWEVSLDKQRQSLAHSSNRFDRFRLRDDLGPLVYWRGDRWLNDEDPSEFAQLTRVDSYANAVLVFSPRDFENYVAINNVDRASAMADTTVAATGRPNPPGLEEFVLNQLQLDGPYGGSQDRSATLSGFPVMFVRSLEGDDPRLLLGATRAGSSGAYRYDVELDFVLHADLLVTGDGDVEFVVLGSIRDFFEPRALVKRGASALTLSGVNTYAGETIIEQGRVIVAGTEAAIENTATVVLGSAGELSLQSGLVRTQAFDARQGGQFDFAGGELQLDLFLGDLLNNGGVFSPGATGMTASIRGDYRQAAGTLRFEIGGTSPGEGSDALTVAGAAMLGGTLELQFVNQGDGVFTPQIGDEFQLLAAAEIIGHFDAHLAPDLEVGQFWSLRQSRTNLSLKVVDQLSADFDQDGAVDEDDLSIWETALGVSDSGDADGDGHTSGADLMKWQRELGSMLLARGPQTAVPEPGAIVLLVVPSIVAAGARFAYRRNAASGSTLAPAPDFETRRN